jgi:hypothetical protein
MRLSPAKAIPTIIVVAAAAFPIAAQARHGADDPPGHVRQASHRVHQQSRATEVRHGSDDGPGHVRHGSDDGPGHARHGSDDGPGHARHGGDDGPNHR